MGVQSQPIKMRRSSTAGYVPPVSEFNLNTFVINDKDSILFFLDSAGAVQGMPLLPGLSIAEQVIASAATTDLGSKASDSIAVTGSTTITSFGVVPNQWKMVRFTGTPTLTHNAASLFLPSKNNINAQVGDNCIAKSDSNGNWTVISYSRADGGALAVPNDLIRGAVPQTLTRAIQAQARKNTSSHGSGIVGIGANTTLTAAHIGSMIYQNSGSYTVTLPDVANLVATDSIDFVNIGSGVMTLAVNGNNASASIYANGAASSTITLGKGQGLTLRYDGGSWISSVYAQGALGFTPVRQGGGPNQNTNQVNLGWANDATGLKYAIDGTDKGYLFDTGSNAQGSASSTGWIQYFPSGLVLTGGTFVGTSDGAGKLTLTMPITGQNPWLAVAMDGDIGSPRAVTGNGSSTTSFTIQSVANTAMRINYMAFNRWKP